MTFENWGVAQLAETIAHGTGEQIANAYRRLVATHPNRYEEIWGEAETMADELVALGSPR